MALILFQILSDKFKTSPMRTLITFLTLFCFNSFLIAQNLDGQKLKVAIDSLQNIINENNKKIDSLKACNSKIASEVKINTDKLNTILTKDQIGEVFICSSNSSIYDKPGLTGSKSIGNLKKGDRVKVTEISDEYSYKIYFNGIVGYVFKSGLKTEAEVNQRLEEVNRKLEEERRQKELMLEQDSIFKEQLIIDAEQRRKDLIKKYGQTNGTKIFEQKIWIGMTKEMVIASWGYPDDINRSVGSWGVHEQMIYGKKYVYIENDILTSWQD